MNSSRFLVYITEKRTNKGEKSCMRHTEIQRINYLLEETSGVK